MPNLALSRVDAAYGTVLNHARSLSEAARQRKPWGERVRGGRAGSDRVVRRKRLARRAVSRELWGLNTDGRVPSWTERRFVVCGGVIAHGVRNRGSFVHDKYVRQNMMVSMEQAHLRKAVAGATAIEPSWCGPKSCQGAVRGEFLPSAVRWRSTAQQRACALDSRGRATGWVR